MTDKFYPILGDMALAIQRAKEKKYILGYMEEYLKQEPKFDVYLAQYGDAILYHICSLKAHEELLKLIQTKVDRQENCDSTIIKLGGGSFTLQKSTDKQRERRNQLTKIVGFNNISRFIPLMIELTDRILSQLKVGEEIELDYSLQKITLYVISKVVFGEDIDVSKEFLPYINKDDTVSQKSFLDGYPIV